MKVGGNESATKYFQSHGGTALLAQKDAKARYTSPVASKYKDELKRRAAQDAKEFPEEVVITDITSPSFVDGTSTPTGEPGADDFFSSWDKPTIKRPSNPPSRSATPVTRTASPFLKPGSSTNRSTSPSGTGDSDTPTSSAPRTISSSTLRKTAATSSATTAGAGGARKTNVLGAKRTQKLGAKKLGASAAEPIDFEEAEKKAKEEAERIAKLGYDPEAEEEAAKGDTAATPLDKPGATSIVAPTPISPVKGPGAGGKGQHQRSASEMERLGMGIGRLGFGQTAGGGAAKAATAKKGLGFGSVGPVKATPEGTSTYIFLTSSPFLITYSHFLPNPQSPIKPLPHTVPLPYSPQKKTDESSQYARQKFGTQKSISSDEFFGKGAFDPSAQAEAKGRLQGFEGATSISSNAYFGRPEDDEAGGGPGGAGGGLAGVDLSNYGDLESAARDIVRRFGVTTADDIENLSNVLGEGAQKLQGVIRGYLNG